VGDEENCASSYFCRAMLDGWKLEVEGGEKRERKCRRMRRLRTSQPERREGEERGGGEGLLRGPEA